MAELIKDWDLFCGDDIKITDKITIKQPTLDNIRKIGEWEYTALIQNMTATHMDDGVIVFLTDLGLDFTKVTDFELFIALSKQFDLNITKILFGDTLNFQELEMIVNSDNKQALVGRDGIYIDETIYKIIVNYLRKVNGISPPQFTRIKDDAVQKEIAIRTAKRKTQSAKKRAELFPVESIYLPLVSSLLVDKGLNLTLEQIQNMKVYSFWYTLKRIHARETADHLYTGLYNGCLDFNKNPSLKNDLDWMRNFKR